MPEEKIKTEQLFEAGLLEEKRKRTFQANLNPILKEIEKNRELPIEERDYLHLYLSLEDFIVKNDVEYTVESLRESIRTKFNTRWFTPRLWALFNLKAPDQLIFSEVILEVALKHLSQDIDITRLQRTLDDLTKNTLLNGIIITREKIDFSVIEKNIFSDETQFNQIVKDINKLLSALHTFSVSILGASRTKAIFSAAFNELKNKYLNIPKFVDALKALPLNIFKEERLELLTREELEKISKRLAKIDVMKSEFTNVAAHELRTPIVPIIGFLGRLVSNPKKFRLTKQVQEQLKICLRNAKRLNSLVGDILTISKLESGEMRFSMENLNLKRIIENTRADLLGLAKEKNLGLGLKLPSKLPNVEGDEKRISQVMTNLVDNAIKFTDKGSITISAKQTDDKVLIQVKDTGIGIDEEDIPRIFTKYYQASIGTEKKGTGLGLAICKAIVERHNGRIWVKSEPGKGSSFYFTLPVKQTTYYKP